MAIIKPKPKSEREKVTMQIDAQVLQEIKHYCQYAGFAKSDEFFEEAAVHILVKDKDFKEWKEQQQKVVNE